jgi:hypothetical protein
MALIARPFTIPAVNGTGTLYVEDVPGLADTAAFAENDWVLLRIMSRAGGGLIVANVWGQLELAGPPKDTFTDPDDDDGVVEAELVE